MKIYSFTIAITLLLTSFYSVASTQQLAWQDIDKWLSQPASIGPWKYQKTSKNNTVLHSLVNTSNTFGGGVLLYRETNKPCFISIPHQFHDKYTLTIGRALFDAHCNMLVHNTHHRHSESPDSHPMDYSKRASGIHVAAVQAFHNKYPNGLIFQLHGFNQKKRKTPQAKKADFILSQGRSYNAKLAKLQSCLMTLSQNTYIYQKDVFELGGTKNVLHKVGLAPHRFIHIEISKPMRKRLKSHPVSMEQFNLCLSYSA
ncbi:hypothetical protein [Pseudoalteromonas luteoviolacea]|uniref:Uncharacterized protein n=1 Tax=Pseudoalteromonas luteoviolacea DSM 6061 TaxID=1365250 RepID=A0A162A286_9GAMM|nr:hypothetical protein [Pseudoalteromonas luteoviolacea]KZN42577.1 hypothetical protein N475_09615 [Pseudoalteromonas luteoviolacea DSM 6061]KZN60010.1 hypothetical protein N474_06335 [Pseudoalteromonas luteoviolacea CPMOR-2]MBE0385229.1 hypothetical protein [Pseudoalteromonas luteoviolacea DSM 6061]TQF69863.1 hypothetical protein FLM44_01835 [Pseudoalteromonas luteoviolacea]